MSAAHHEATTVSPFRRLRKTPIRDLLRGRITGRLSPEIQCRDAALPQPILETVCATARRTRLLRIERAEVAQELIAHFRDGLDAKRAATDLVDAFGDTRTAARLIRRAKKRDRAFTLKLAFGSLKAIGVVILLIILVYAALAARYFTTRPGPIVEYAPRVNAAALAVPAEDRAWPLYREILLTDGLREELRAFPDGARPGWRDWPKTEAFLREHADILDRLRAAAAKPGLGLVVVGPMSAEDARLWPDINPEPNADTQSLLLLDTLLPYLADFRRLAALLSADAILAAEQGDAPRAAANILALLGIANHSRETPFLINDLVGISLASLAIRETLAILDKHPDLLTDAHLQRIAHALAAFPTDAEPPVRLYGDQMAFDDMVQRLYSLDSDGDGVIAPGAFSTIKYLEGRAVATPAFAEHAAGPVFSALVATRKETVDFYRQKSDAALAWIREPAWTRPPYTQPFDELDSTIARARYFLPALLMPAYAGALLQGERFQTTRDAALCVIAIERFRRDHGEPPEALADLTPRYIPRTPLDPFTGKPLRYQTRADGFILYSVGNNYTDNAGTIPEDANPAEFANTAGRWIARQDAQALLESPDHIVKYNRWSPREQVGDGDWILYPPPLPEEPPLREEFPM